MRKDLKTPAGYDPSDLTPERLNKRLLDTIFAHAVAEDRYLTPDDAMTELLKTAQRLASESGDQEIRQSLPRVHLDSLTRKLHRYAVDVFYRTYFPPPSRGRPRIPNGSLAHLLELKGQGLTDRAIAKSYGLPTGTPKDREASADTVRHQVKVAKKRLAE